MWQRPANRPFFDSYRYSRQHERRDRMASPELKTISDMLRARQQEAPADISFPESRALFEQMTAAFPLPPGVTTTPVDVGGIPGEWIAAPGAGDEHTIYW